MNIYAPLSGICGALASYAGKLAFQDEQLIYYRLVFLALMLYLNKWMFQFSFKSMQSHGSSITVLLQFITGNALNGLNGYILGETLSINWAMGMLMLTIGVHLLS